MVIDINSSAKEIHELFGASEDRCKEMLDYFNGVFKKHSREIFHMAQQCYAAEEEKSMEFDYNPIIIDCLRIADNPSEAAFAAYCAHGVCQKMDDYGHEVMSHLGLINSLINATNS